MECHGRQSDVVWCFRSQSRAAAAFCAFTSRRHIRFGVLGPLSTPRNRPCMKCRSAAQDSKKRFGMKKRLGMVQRVSVSSALLASPSAAALSPHFSSQDLSSIQVRDLISRLGRRERGKMEGRRRGKCHFSADGFPSASSYSTVSRQATSTGCEGGKHYVLVSRRWAVSLCGRENVQKL